MKARTSDVAAATAVDVFRRLRERAWSRGGFTWPNVEELEENIEEAIVRGRGEGEGEGG